MLFLQPRGYRGIEMASCTLADGTHTNVEIPQKRPIPERWIPSDWTWFWQAKKRIFGRPNVVSLRTQVLTVSPLSDSELTALVMAKADYSDENGVRIWILSESNLNLARERLELKVGSKGRIFLPPVSATDGMAQVAHVPQSQVLHRPPAGKHSEHNHCQHFD